MVGMSGIIEMAGNILADYMAFDPEVEFEINEFTNIKRYNQRKPGFDDDGKVLLLPTSSLKRSAA